MQANRIYKYFYLVVRMGVWVEECIRYFKYKENWVYCFADIKRREKLIHRYYEKINFTCSIH